MNAFLHTFTYSHIHINNTSLSILSDVSEQHLEFISFHTAITFVIQHEMFAF